MYSYRKNDLLNTKIAYKHKFHYDFVELLNKHFIIDPRSAYVPSGIEIDIFHSELEIDLIDDYSKQYGTDVIGLSRIVLRANLNRLYRTSTKADTKGKNIKTTLRKNKRSNLKLIT